jgi:UDP-galactopyranose mutase
LYAEVAYSQNKPIDKRKIEQQIIQDLIKANIITRSDQIKTLDYVDIKYGYVIYDSSYSQIMPRILSFLKRHNIFSIGRYGRWQYMSMEDAILDGMKTAENLNA